jgi:hypothetical protein
MLSSILWIKKCHFGNWHYLIFESARHFSEILILFKCHNFQSKRFGNSVGNGWSRSNPEITISNCGLNASRNPNGFLFQNVYAEKGFPISGQNSREDNFPGTILYYYEIKISKSELW